MKFLARIFAAALAVTAAFAVLVPVAAPAYAAENTLSVQTVDVNGLDIALSAANTDGSQFLNPSDQRTFVVCANSNGSTRTVTLETQVSSVAVPGFGSVTVTDQASVVPLSTGLTIIGPIPYAQFTDASGYAHITFSATAGLTCGVARLATAAN